MSEINAYGVAIPHSNIHVFTFMTDINISCQKDIAYHMKFPLSCYTKWTLGLVISKRPFTLSKRHLVLLYQMVLYL